MCVGAFGGRTTKSTTTTTTTTTVVPSLPPSSPSTVQLTIPLSTTESLTTTTTSTMQTTTTVVRTTTTELPWSTTTITTTTASALRFPSEMSLVFAETTPPPVESSVWPNPDEFSGDDVTVASASDNENNFFQLRFGSIIDLDKGMLELLLLLSLLVNVTLTLILICFCVVAIYRDEPISRPPQFPQLTSPSDVGFQTTSFESPTYEEIN